MSSIKQVFYLILSSSNIKIHTKNLIKIIHSKGCYEIMYYSDYKDNQPIHNILSTKNIYVHSETNDYNLTKEFVEHSVNNYQKH